MTATLAPTGDYGSTLTGVSLPILGVLLVGVLFVAFVVLPTWRQRHDAKRGGRKVDGRRES